ncbi:hypothetical protein RIF29_18727 [Crotalaria pallida]|uniref:Uncharacterized protein n=1 Tax=Crotalaria pallida TaxID=3830 RepID=A0AAN9EY46_CROPI
MLVKDGAQIKDPPADDHSVQLSPESGGGSGGPDGGRNTNGDVTMEDNQGAKITEENLVIPRDKQNNGKNMGEQISLDNCFGPWMLVKRPMRRKDSSRGTQNPKKLAINNNDLVGKKLPKINSRFEALEYDRGEPTKVERENQEVLIVKKILPLLKVNPVWWSPTLKTNKVLLSLKRLETRWEVGILNTREASPICLSPILKKIHKPDTLNTKPVPTRNEVDPSASKGPSPSIDQESHRMEQGKTEMKHKEEEMLRLMRYYQKENKNQCNELFTQSMLQSREVIEHVQQRKMIQTSQPQIDKPPGTDLLVVLKGCGEQELEMAHEEYQVGMQAHDMAIDTFVQPGSGNPSFSSC